MADRRIVSIRIPAKNGERRHLRVGRQASPKMRLPNRSLIQDRSTYGQNADRQGRLVLKPFEAKLGTSEARTNQPQLLHEFVFDQVSPYASTEFHVLEKFHVRLADGDR